MVQHTMPLMEPGLYERTIHESFEGREVVRWYIASIDEATGTVTAEVVVVDAMET